MLVVPAFASADTTISRSGSSGNYIANAIADPAPNNQVIIDEIWYSGSSGGVVVFEGEDLDENDSNCAGNSTQVYCVIGNSSNLSEVRVTLGAANGNLVQADADFSRRINVLAGYTGNSRIVGGDAIDTINGGSGNDDIEGGDANDIINGNGGADHMAGNNGVDTLNGGEGDDMIGAENNHDADNVDCGPGNDIIGLDLNASGVSEEATPIATIAASCERQLPHTYGSGTLSGDPVAGTTVSGNALTVPRYGFQTPDLHRYRWYRCTSAVAPRAWITALAPSGFESNTMTGVNPACTPIAGGIQSSVTVDPAWVGQYLAAVGQSGLSTTAGSLNPGIFATESYTSIQGRIIVAAPVAPSNTAAPTISGATVVGTQLTASPGTWAGSGPITFTYQWQRCNAAGDSCANIGDATSPTYILTAADLGSTVRAVVTGDNVVAGTVDATSATTGVVQAVPVATKTVTGVGVTAFTASSKVTCKKGKCSVKVTTSAAGKVTIKGSKVKTVTKTVGAGTTTITVKLTSKAKKSLKNKGKLKTSVKVTATSNSGVDTTANAKLSYKK
jgi:hypothetical protein